jgi:nucleotide-binding universal stress UspA family protein
MTWKRILIHYRAYDTWSPSMDVSIALAKQHGAHLTGLYTIRELAMLKLLFGPHHKAVQEAEARDAPLTAAAKTQFLEACAKAGVSATWDVGEGNAQELISLAGRCHDLVVLEQSPGGLEGLGTDVVEECAVACGTPTMIVPQQGSFPSVGKHPVIAWNHSRQSAVALQGALPMLMKADKVTVLIGKERDVLSSVTRRPGHDISEYLRAHGVKAEVKPFEVADSDAGAELLSTVSRVGGDVLVMGAYGRSSWREFLFGGATRHVLTSLQVPVLMGH